MESSFNLAGWGLSNQNSGANQSPHHDNLHVSPARLLRSNGNDCPQQRRRRPVSHGSWVGVPSFRVRETSPKVRFLEKVCRDQPDSDRNACHSTVDSIQKSLFSDCDHEDNSPRWQTPPRTRADLTILTVTPIRPARLETESGQRTTLKKRDLWIPPVIHKIVHPSFELMEEPIISFRAHDCDRLDQTDPADMLVAVAQMYVQEMRLHGRMAVFHLQPSVPAAVAIAAVSLALHALGGKTGPCKLSFSIGQERHPTEFGAAFVDCQKQKQSLLDAWQQSKNMVAAMKRRLVLEQLSPAACRLSRLACASATLWFASSSPGATDLISHTKLLPWVSKNRLWIPKQPELKLSLSRRSAVDVGVDEARQGRHVVVMVLVSEQNPGSALILEGKTIRIEEDACMRSDLYLAFCAAVQQGEAMELANGDGCRVHVPDDGALLCPGVQFFRESAIHDFAPLAVPVKLAAVIAVSMPHISRRPTSVESHDSRNRSPSQRQSRRPDLSSDRNRSQTFDLDSAPGYLEMLVHKFEMVLDAANAVLAEVLVVSDVGVGERFGGNPAHVVGHAVGLAIKTARGQLSEIILTGCADFQMAVRKALAPHPFKLCRARADLNASPRERAHNSQSRSPRGRQLDTR